MEFYSIEAKLNDQDTVTVFVCELQEAGTYWYAVEGSLNFNESTLSVEPFDGMDLCEDTNDIDNFTNNSPVYNLTQFEEIMIDHLEEETTKKVDLHINLESANDAFQDDPCNEVARILRELANKIEQGRDVGDLLDINGNKCGGYYLDILED